MTKLIKVPVVRKAEMVVKRARLETDLKSAFFLIGTYRNKSYFVTVRDLRKEAHTVKKRKITVRDSKTWSCIASQNGRFPFKE